MTYAVHWRDPVTGHQASTWHETEPEADAAADALWAKHRLPSVVAWWPELARDEPATGPLTPERPAGVSEAAPMTESA